MGSEHFWELAPQNLYTTPARESDLEVKIVKKLAVSGRFWKLSLAKFAPRLRLRAISKSKSLKTGRLGARLEVQLRKICTTPARETDFEVNIAKAPWDGALLEVELPSRLRARTIWKSKSLKTDGLGTFLEVQSAFRVAGAGISTRCKMQNTWQPQDFVRVAENVGRRRRGGFEEGPKRCVSRGRRKDFGLCEIDV